MRLQRFIIDEYKSGCAFPLFINLLEKYCGTISRTQFRSKYSNIEIYQSHFHNLFNTLFLFTIGIIYYNLINYRYIDYRF